MSDNPFDEDSDRTQVVRPNPGGARPAPRAASPPAPPPADPFGGGGQNEPALRPMAAMALPADGAETIVNGLNPLVSAAGPLLALLGRLGRTLNQPNPADLRDRTLQQIQGFERAANAAGASREQIVRARYALCASLDDVAQATPWGGNGVWASRPLVSSFGEALRGYEGIQSGVGFFKLLDDVKNSPGTELPLLELMYLCLSLGFQGKFRVSERPMAELDKVRHDLHTIISNRRPAAENALSPHWEGLAVPYKPARAVVPSWVTGAAAAFAIGGLFVWFSSSLNASSDAVFERQLGAPQAAMPQIARIAPVKAPPPPPPPAEPETLYIFLKPEIDQGLVSVLGDRSMPIVRIRNRGMFPSGSATVAPAYVRLLERIGEALKVEKGPVQVVGYTDNQPIKTIQFPSNYQLSTARAEAARTLIVRALGDAGRVTAEGRADADPIGSNATPEGRDDNRRIEVILRRLGQ